MPCESPQVRRRCRAADANADADAGFTLLELVVTLGLVALTLALALPAMRAATDQSRYKVVVARLAADLRTARALAMTSGRTVAFQLAPAERSYTLAGRLRWPFPPAVGVSLRSPAALRPRAGASQIDFFPDGSSSGGRLAVTEHAATSTIAVDWLSGAVSVRDGP